MEFLIKAPSHYVNVINFLIFEVFLITAIFFLTADVSGRLNFLSLISGEEKKLVVISPPILGGGICTTSFPRGMSMLLIRGLGVCLIFGTALTIDGDKRGFIKERLATVRAPAPITERTDAKVREFKVAISRRTSCQVLHEGFIYHGLLYSNGICEYDIKLKDVRKQIHYSYESELLSLKMENCESSFVKVNSYARVEFKNCSNAMIACYYFLSKQNNSDYQFDANSCLGMVYPEKKQYICSSFDSREGMIWKGQCRRSYNVETVKNYWLYSSNVSDAGVIDVIGALSVLGEEKRKVEFFEFKMVTTVNKIWYGILALKVLIVVALLFISAALKRRGAKCVLNDENSLACLLRSSVHDAFGMSLDEFKLYVHCVRVGQNIHYWPSKLPQKRDENVRIHELESVYH